MLVSKGAAGHPGWFGAVDILSGSATFFGLGFAMIGTVALIKTLGGPELIDLGIVLGHAHTPGSILNDGSAYIWLYLTFLSTLLPTLIHGFIATFAFVAMWPEWIRKPIATGLDSGSSLKGKPACLMLAFMMALSVAMPLTLIYYAVWGLAAYYPQAGEALIACFRWFAVLSGAI